MFRFFIVYLLLLLLFGIFGGWRWYEDAMKRPEYGYVQFEGCIAEMPDERSDKVKYVVEADFGRVLINAGRYPLYEYGKCFLIEGVLREPEEFNGFDYPRYLAGYDIYALMSKPKMTMLKRQEGNVFYEVIGKVRKYFEEGIMVLFGEPHASFLMGILLGAKSGLPAELMEDFNMVGLTHIVAVSGYNVSIVILAVMSIFSFLGRRAKVILGILFVVIFVILVGASAAAVRAGIMGVISLVALFLGKNYLAMRALIFSAVLMTVFNPKVLSYDVGFQLSFLATAGIILLGKRIENRLKFVPQFLQTRQTLATTLAAQVFCLPIIFMEFGSFSLISPIANLFVLPLIPLAMMVGFAAVVFGFLNDSTGSFIGFFAYSIINVILFFVKMFAKIPLQIS